MSQIDSHFNEIITQFRPLLPTNIATRQTIDDGYSGSAGELATLVEANEYFAPLSAMRFKDLRCPVCNRFQCEWSSVQSNRQRALVQP